jgi:hypothetical protein
LIGWKNDCIPEKPAASLSSFVCQPFLGGAMVAVAFVGFVILLRQNAEKQCVGLL